jgi:hypothetical protein
MPKKMILICIKYFVENKSSLSHHIMKEKKKKRTPTPFLQPPHPIPPKTDSLENKEKLNLAT